MTTSRTIHTLWKPVDNQIFALAVPSFFALAAEPVFLLTDTAFVARLGSEPLAGMGVASAVLTTVVGLCVFLAYGTTGEVARALGGEDRQRAARLSVDGVWLSLVVGVLVAGVLALAGGVALRAMSAPPEAMPDALAYFTVSLWGLPAALLAFGATGALRGYSDAVTPLVVATSSAVLNIPLNYVLIFTAGLGVEGSALGTVIVQWLAAFALVTAVVRKPGVSQALRPRVRGMVDTARRGVPLIVRTACLRVGIIGTTFVAASGGVAVLAAHHVTFQVWGFLAFTLDALAMAAQTMTGLALGRGDEKGLRETTRRLFGHGVVLGVVTTVVLAAMAPVLAGWFVAEPDVRGLLVPALWVAAGCQVLAAYVFVADGVLIGASEGPYLARSSILVAVGYVPLLVATYVFAPAGLVGLLTLWLAYGVGFMGLRAVTLWWRLRTLSPTPQ